MANSRRSLSAALLLGVVVFLLMSPGCTSTPVSGLKTEMALEKKSDAAGRRVVVLPRSTATTTSSQQAEGISAQVDQVFTSAFLTNSTLLPLDAPPDNPAEKPAAPAAAAAAAGHTSHDKDAPPAGNNATADKPAPAAANATAEPGSPRDPVECELDEIHALIRATDLDTFPETHADIQPSPAHPTPESPSPGSHTAAHVPGQDNLAHKDGPSVEVSMINTAGRRFRYGPTHALVLVLPHVCD